GGATERTIRPREHLRRSLPTRRPPPPRNRTGRPARRPGDRPAGRDGRGAARGVNL
ncbi:MAG: hypothetical protein AVDCRST_MAG19-2371, partial [uncultured Thermomicrobiales bacterium]